MPENTIHAEVELTRKQIACELGISVRQVDTYVELLKAEVPGEFKYETGQRVFTTRQREALHGTRELFLRKKLSKVVRVEIRKRGLPGRSSSRQPQTSRTAATTTIDIQQLSLI